MFGTILWMHDTSAHADRARHPVEALARATGAPVVVAHAAGPEGDGTHAREALARLVPELGHGGIPARLRVEEVTPAAASAAWAGRGDLVVVCQSRVSGLDRFLVGSTARRILRSTAASVLVVAGRPFHALERILVTVDVDEHDDTAILQAAALARATGAALDAVAVVPAGSGMEDVDGTEVRVRTHVERALGGALPAGWTATALMAESSLEGILYAAEGHDLVALTTHGRTGLARLLEGSVAEDVIRQCPVSVLVAR